MDVVGAGSQREFGRYRVNEGRRGKARCSNLLKIKVERFRILKF